ncbi:hypothetical protein F4802DRAFT_615626 [Xylaria palmicola]|nr:hypothetical protein F4802DRAFT_615626 [Xylaria palmicola]
MAAIGLGVGDGAMSDDMKYIINHVILPPQLPQSDDYNPASEEQLVHRAIEAFRLFRTILQQAPSDTTEPVAICHAFNMLNNLAGTYSVGETSACIDEIALGDALSRLHKDAAPIPLYVHAQNAGIIVSSAADGSDDIHFELFELSPLNKDVMNHAGRLQRTFPGCAIAVPRREVQTRSFLQTLTDTLAKMSYQPAAGTTPKVKKAGQMHQEDRDTVHPMMVTELLAAYLRSVGRMEQVSAVLKNTRQDILWRNARSPWRRSALWLLVRVTLQLFFSRRQSESAEVDTYKNYMLLLTAHILQQAQASRVSVDLVWTIKAKVTRRRLKLGVRGHPAIIRFVDNILSEAGADLQRRWSHIQDSDSITHDFADLKELPAVYDTLTPLEKLDRYLDAITKRQHHTPSDYTHNSWPLPDFKSPLHKSFNEYPISTPTTFKLLLFESWVKSSLGAYLPTGMRNEQGCTELKLVIESYYRCASPHHQGNPEAMSAMFLTITQLWIALDEIAIGCCSLLADYDHGFPVEILRNLILPERSQMRILRFIEQYLTHRSSNAKFRSAYTLSFYGHGDSFAVRYFDQSEEQQKALSDIEQQAQVAKAEKWAEFDRKRNEYRNHLAEYDRLVCQYKEKFNHRTGSYKRQHRSSCERCKHKAAMSSLKIQLYEWPLPDGKNEAKTVVFELLAPPAFRLWRDSKLFMLTSVLGFEYMSHDEPAHRYTTGDIAELCHFSRSNIMNQRVSLLSQIKPHSGTHRDLKSVISSSIQEICVKNGMKFHYFDQAKGCFINDCTPTRHLVDACTYKLSDSSRHLQKYLDGTVHPTTYSNTALARQSECPQILSLDEYKGMTALQDGNKLIWQNHLKELTSPSMDFKKIDTVFAILQCLQQAGAPGTHDILREIHNILEDERFSAVLLASLSDACREVSRNWQAASALSVYVSIACRVLSLSSAPNIQQSALQILSIARAISINWVKTLKGKSQRATEDRVRDEFAHKSNFAALVCATSFDIDSRHMHDVLSVSEQAAILIRTAIVIQENQNEVLDKPSSLTSLLYYRWQRVSRRTHPILAKLIVEDRSPALDEAIKTSWAAYKPAGQWVALKPPHDHWLSMSASNKDYVIHFSVLTGELLVNGLPLNRLPREYERNPAYGALFGKSLIEVLPSSVKGMCFSGKQTFAGYTLHFNLSTEGNTLPEPCLLVKASSQDLTFELIPSCLFSETFPVEFVDGFVHWYNVTEDYVEFRPRDRPWFHSDDNWKLCRVGEKNAWVLNKAEKSLVNIHSTTATRLCGIFQALENASYIHIILERNTYTLEISLPRIQLGFSLCQRETSIKSHQHRGMSVHEHQKVGTLIGLQSKLVLKSNKTNSRDKVVIPNGIISWHKKNGHIHVTVDKSSSTKVRVYEIDRQLGRILDNGTVTSKLFLAFLHSLTSFCLPDFLTGSTGTISALTILRSAAIRSYPSIRQSDLDLLLEISKLTPRREYYPNHLREMETVHWSPSLGFLAQHSEYYECVKSLFEHVERFNLFYPEECVRCPTLPVISSALLQRERIRSAVVQAWGYGVQYYIQADDKVYSSRDRSQNSEKALRALSLSKTISQGVLSLQVPIQANIGDQLWEFICQDRLILVSGPASSAEDFRYDATFLIDSPKDIADEFMARARALKAGQTQLDKHRVMMWLATLSFAEIPSLTVLQVLASFYICPRMQVIDEPKIVIFDLSYGFKLLAEAVKYKVMDSTHDFSETRDAVLPKHQDESDQQWLERRWRTYKEGVDRIVANFVQGITSQWPCEVPQVPPDVGPDNWNAYINVDKIMIYLRTRFQNLHNNLCLREYLCHLGGTAITEASVALNIPICMPLAVNTVRYRDRAFISSDDLFSGVAPLQIASIEPQAPYLKFEKVQQRNMSLLPSLLTRLDQITGSLFEVNYMADLRDSLSALRNNLSALNQLEYEWENKLDKDKMIKLLIQHQDIWKYIVDTKYAAIIDAMTEAIQKKLHSNNEESMSPNLFQHFMQPCPILLLQQLSRRRWSNLSENWKKCLISYGMALAQLQRANRLLDVVGSPASLIKELRNKGHQNWDPYENPESLLLEIENGIMIRTVQEQIAAQMRNPLSGQNSVMQLNMGEGKSSVIVPIVAISLADTTQLVRVIVAKPQSKQMLQMLVSKLGGLVDRQIYHLPFSRAIKIENNSLRAIEQLLKECMQSGGILLTQPENILSLMLMGIESCTAGKLSASQTLTKTLSFLDAHSRDIVNESDENFSVKFELLYTIGMQRPVQYSPKRWTYVQNVLGIFKKVAAEVQHRFPSSIEIHSQSSSGFPRIRVLRTDAQSRIITRIGEEICEKGLAGFPIVRQQKSYRQAVFSYITELRPSSDVTKMVEDSNPTGFWTKSHNTLLLLRGLLAGGILSYCFRQKRWRVNYGLDSSRKPPTKLALPFRAKDSPTPRSEFSHPEIIIILTQLSYYYGGLSNEELVSTFVHLINSDQADQEFQGWVKGTSELPSEFRQLNGINLADRSTCEEEIFPHFRVSSSAINYFLSHIVFPREMKEFPSKLSASGWDIGKVKACPTTGFSGTNDSRAVLPLSITQLDIDEQKHTNALVLEYLLQSENSVEIIPPHTDPQVSDAKLLLNMVILMSPPARVILDVGALILELDNLGVAQEWLSNIAEPGEIEAVVFFDANDELLVLDRKGHTEPLQVSPYINQLDLCLVFLDEAHTRGTELKLPRDYRAAVTLGAHLTKDRLVQACMRMRQLGAGQSVVFCVPQDICSEIKQRLPETVGDISVSDVLAWAIIETWDDTRRNIPLWAAQGRRYERHKDLWARCHTAGDVITEELAENFLEDEASSLENRYRPLQHQPGAHQPDDGITRRCKQFKNLELMFAVLEEEQERELAPEIEKERQDERPALSEPEEHSIHPDIRVFATNGRIFKTSKGYMDAFKSLKGTSAASLFNISGFQSGLLVSADFAQTVKVGSLKGKSDEYQRPVRWVLTASRTPHGALQTMMIISPYEANELLPDIQKSEYVALHLYAPRLGLGYRSLDKLDLYTVPDALKDREIPQRFITELNLFAGQLYINSFDEYIDICKFLGLAWEPAKDGEVIGADGFIYRDHKGQAGGESGLGNSPVEFFKALFTKIRRNCVVIDKTHMGQVLENRLLSPEDFE